MPQKGAGHLPKERLHDIEPRSVFRCQHGLETVGAGSEQSSGLFGNVRRLIIQDDPDGAIRRVVSVEILEQGDEFAAAVPALNAGCDMALMQIQRRENRARSKALVLMIPAHAGIMSTSALERARFSRRWICMRAMSQPALSAGTAAANSSPCSRISTDTTRRIAPS